MRISRLLSLLAVGALAAAAVPPYPPSPVIARVEFDFSTHRRLAPGSDNWPVTWADDGHLYGAWGKNTNDSWNTVAGRFLPRATSP